MGLVRELWSVVQRAEVRCRTLALVCLACGLTAVVLAPSALAAAAPTCNDDPYEETQAGSALDIDFDCSGGSGALTYAIVSGPSHGQLGQPDNADGDVTYTASESYSGTDSFTYKATDASKDTSNTAKVTVTVDPENECSDDGYEQTPTGQALDITLQCSSGTGANESYSIVSEPSNGTLDTSDLADGDVTYTPKAGFNGIDSFTFTANDGVMKAKTATVSISVGNACTSQTVTTRENEQEPTEIDLSCVSANHPGGSETYSIVSQPSHGSLSSLDATDGVVDYTPAHGFSGTDTFTFKANDGSDNSNTAIVTIDVTPPPPECGESQVTTPENTAVTIPLSCISPGGETLTLSIPSDGSPQHGTLSSINQSAQTVTYTPDSGYVSDFDDPDQFSYEATDSDGTVSDEAGVSVQVGVACGSFESTTTPEGAPVEVEFGCSGPSGVQLSLSDPTAPAHGTIGKFVSEGDGAYQVDYTPVAGYHGSDSFTVVATGGGHSSAPATIAETVEATGLSCQGNAVSTAKGAAITIPVDCMNVSGSLTLQTAPSGSPAHGTLSYNSADETITYTPTAGFTGADSFTYEASDSSGATPTATISVAVGISCPGGTVTTTENEPVSVPLYCSGPDGVPLTLAVSSQPSHGTVGQVQPIDNTVLYTPTSGFAGTDSLKYTATGGGQTTAPATVTITISAPMPQCSDVDASTAPGQAVVIPLECGGPAGTTLTLAATSQPQSGTLGSVDESKRTVTYTPKAGFVGSDFFTYDATGGGATAEDATVSVTVGPTCSDNDDAITENQPTELALQCVGPRGQTLTLSVPSGGGPKHGALGYLDSTDEEVLYTPTQGYTGPDAFSYEANAGSTTSNVAVEQVLVEAPTGPYSEPAAPSCSSVNVSTAVGAQVKIPLTCTDPAGATLTLSVVSGDGPSHGTLSSVTQGTSPSVTYTPVAGYSGADTFEYESSNGNAVSDPAYVSIQVGVTCEPETAYGVEGQPADLSLDCSGPGALAYQVVSGPSHGTLGTVGSDGEVEYTPTSGTFTGQDSFTFKATSGAEASTTVTDIIDIAEAPPTCTSTSVSTAMNTSVKIPLSCTDPSGTTLTLSVPSNDGPQNGSLSAITQGSSSSVTYTPTSGFQGQDTFSYTASDGSVESVPTEVDVNVGVSCSDSTQQVTENQTATITLDCTGPTGTPVTMSAASQPGHGTLGAISQSQDTVSYTPANGYTGPDTFEVTAKAGSSTSAPAVITLDVTPPAPTCSDVQVSTDVGKAVSVPLSCSGGSGGTLTLEVDGSPLDGTLGAINQTQQTVQYTPDQGFVGTDSFTYNASDGEQLSEDATVNITVGSSPVCTTVTAAVTENTSTRITFSCHGGSGAYTFATTTTPAHGTLSGLDATGGSVSYTPATGYTGSDSFDYRVTDAEGVSSPPVEVAITVSAGSVTTTTTTGTTTTGTTTTGTTTTGTTTTGTTTTGTTTTGTTTTGTTTTGTTTTGTTTTGTTTTGTTTTGTTTTGTTTTGTTTTGTTTTGTTGTTTTGTTGTTTTGTTTTGTTTTGTTTTGTTTTGTTTTSTGSPLGSIRLGSGSTKVSGNGSVTFSLHFTGSGKVTLVLTTTKPGKHGRRVTVQLGSVSATLTKSPQSLIVHLSRAGRSLLKADGGKLPVTWLIKYSGHTASGHLTLVSSAGKRAP